MDIYHNLFGDSLSIFMSKNVLYISFLTHSDAIAHFPGKNILEQKITGI